jgi:dTDP-4-amino-4,6-dideoxygalactose transaminase
VIANSKTSSTASDEMKADSRAFPESSVNKPVVAKQRIMPMSWTRMFAPGTPADEELFLSALQTRLGPGVRTIPLGRARAGIYLLSRIAVTGSRRKILMSPYTIPDVVTMVILAGAEPVFFDFEPGSTTCDLASLKALIDSSTAAVIVTHYHVNEPNLDAIADICRRNGAFLFDDCAISFSGSIRDRPIGTLTDASVFSFSSFKLLNFFWGGLIATRNPQIAEAAGSAVSAWPRLKSSDYSGAARRCIQYDLATRPVTFRFLVFPFFTARLRLGATPRALEHTRIETAELDATITSRPALAAFSEWRGKLHLVDKLLANRRAIARIYRQYLAHVMVSANTSESGLEGACFVNFPVVLPRDSCRRIHGAMMLAGFDVGRSLYPNSHRHPKFTGVAGHSANVDRLLANTIYLPTHFGVSPAYAHALGKRLAREIN